MGMKVDQVLHMVVGAGETSYATNSRLQEKAIFRTRPIVEEAIREVYTATLPEKLVVADLGCASGPNTLLVISNIIHEIVGHCRRLGNEPPEIQCFLNDLPGNDFNTIFQYSSMEFKKQMEEKQGEELVPNYYVAGVPGSFYGRLFPNRSVHFFHSNFCLTWLSQGLLNEEKVDAFNIPFYSPSLDEVKAVIENEAAFCLDQVDTFESNWDPFDDSSDDTVLDDTRSGENVANSIRAAT